MANRFSFHSSQSRDLRVRALTAADQDGVVTRHRAEAQHQACPGPSPPSPASPISGPTEGPWSRPGSRRISKTSTDLSSQWAMEIFENKINKVWIFLRQLFISCKRWRCEIWKVGGDDCEDGWRWPNQGQPRLATAGLWSESKKWWAGPGETQRLHGVIANTPGPPGVRCDDVMRHRPGNTGAVRDERDQEKTQTLRNKWCSNLISMALIPFVMMGQILLSVMSEPPNIWDILSPQLSGGRGECVWWYNVCWEHSKGSGAYWSVSRSSQKFDTMTDFSPC